MIIGYLDHMDSMDEVYEVGEGDDPHFDVPEMDCE